MTFFRGNFGQDTLDGGAGNDELLTRGGTDTLLGGEGDDDIRVELLQSAFPNEENARVDAGAGNDTVFYQAGRTVGGSIDLGAGDDLVELNLDGFGWTMALGEGNDTIEIVSLGFLDGYEGTLTDFEAGDNGEVITFEALRTSFFENYNGISNPLGTGHMVLSEDDQGGSTLEFHREPTGPVTFTLNFPNVALADFTAHNFGGFDPSGRSEFGPPILGTDDSETITGTEAQEEIDGRGGDDIINAGEGDDTIIGGPGSDTLNGEDGDDVFVFDLGDDIGNDPRLDAAINGGAGNDTLSISGPNNISQINLDTDLNLSSIERILFSDNANISVTALIETASALIDLSARELRIDGTGQFTPGGRLELDGLNLPNDGSNVDLSGPEVYILNVRGGTGDDFIIGPDAAFENPNPFNYNIFVEIQTGTGNDTVIAGNHRSRITTTDGNNTITGSPFDDSIFAQGTGFNILNGGDGDDEIGAGSTTTYEIDGGAGNDTISVRAIASGNIIRGGEGTDTLNISTSGSQASQVDLGNVTFSDDIEILTSSGRGEITLTVDQIASFDVVAVRSLIVADAGNVTLTQADSDSDVRLSAFGNTLDVTAITTFRIFIDGGIANDVIFGANARNVISGGRGNDALYGQDQDDTLSGGDGVDLLFGARGDDTLFGGSNVDTVVLRGDRSQYTIEQPFNDGLFRVSGPDGIDTLGAVEFIQFDDETVHLRRGPGVQVNFETTNPADYQFAMREIRDFDGNFLGGDGNWLRIGSADINGDGDIDQILVNDAIGRFATVGTDENGLVYFQDFSWAGETRVAGIYIDPLVQSGLVARFGPNDSQQRFQNDLSIENINRVLGADDYDGDGLQDVYFALTDGTAYLRAIMEADGNIRYANYQDEQGVIDFLTANGFGEETYGDWFNNGGTSQGSAPAEVAINPEAMFDFGMRRSYDAVPAEFFG